MISDLTQQIVQATAQLRIGLGHAIAYELEMKSSLAQSPGLASTEFYPAAVNAYCRIQLLLDRPITRQTVELVHAEFLGVFEQEHYGGAQFQYCAMQIDDWIDDVGERHDLPFFYYLIHDRLYLAEMNLGPLPHRQYLVAQDYMERRQARQMKRKNRHSCAHAAPSNQ